MTSQHQAEVCDSENEQHRLCLQPGSFGKCWRIWLDFSDSISAHSPRTMYASSFSPAACVRCFNFLPNYLLMSMLTRVSLLSISRKLLQESGFVRSHRFKRLSHVSAWTSGAETSLLEKYNMLPYNCGASGWSRQRGGSSPPPPAAWKPNLAGVNRWGDAPGNSWIVLFFLCANCSCSNIVWRFY